MVFGRSTSVKATAKPFVVAGVCEPGRKKSTFVTVESLARKIWSPENVRNSVR